MKITDNKCPKCGKENWTWIPDSLAQNCKCGFVRVQSSDGKDWEIGPSIQEWLNDTFESMGLCRINFDNCGEADTVKNRDYLSKDS